MDEVSKRGSELRPSICSGTAPVLALLPVRFSCHVLGEN